jgi:hypothetical protein
MPKLELKRNSKMLKKFNKTRQIIKQPRRLSSKLMGLTEVKSKK